MLQVEDMAEDDDGPHDMTSNPPGRYEEDDNVAKLFRQNATFEELLATLGDLYTTTLGKVIVN